MNTQKGFAPILLILLGLVLIGGGVYFYTQNSSKDFTKKFQNSLAMISSNSIFESFSNKKNLNLGTIRIRAIVVNIDEVGNKYGSMGEKFTPTKLTEVNQSLKRLNTFVKNSSYNKAKLDWTVSGIYELGSGVCNHDSYGEKVNDLIQRALEKEDTKNPIPDYSFYLIVHPIPDCGNNEMWSFEGRGNFAPYTLNGRTVNLRGIHISDLSDEYLFHEFGHSLPYKENTNIGHPAYLSCPITKNNNGVDISLSNACKSIYDWNTGDIPVYTIMSAKRGISSDYNAIEKELIGWLTNLKNVTDFSSETYKLSPLESKGSNSQVIKIPIKGTNYVAYISFRQPLGYTYPSSPTEKPNGVIVELKNDTTESFLITDKTNKNSPLKVGVSYKIGESGPFIMVESINNKFASVRISSKSTGNIPELITNPSCVITANKNSYKLGETIVFSWTSKGATYTNWVQDTSGKDHLILPEDKLSINGSQSVVANVLGNPSVTLSVKNSNSSGSCSKTVSVTN